MTDWHPDIPHEYRSQIVTGDARELAKRIPDESVDLIFTDPVYDRIEDYEWLAQTAARVLKPDSACLVFGSAGSVDKHLSALSLSLDYRWFCDWNLIGIRGGRNYGKIVSKITPLYWYEKGRSKLLEYWFDVQPVSFGNDKLTKNMMSVHQHRWSKPPGHIGRSLRSFCTSNAIVFDPFTGSGTVPAVCKMLQRNYIAFEIDPDTAEAARERVRNTQPPLPLVEPAKQSSFDI